MFLDFERTQVWKVGSNEYFKYIQMQARMNLQSIYWKIWVCVDLLIVDWYNISAGQVLSFQRVEPQSVIQWLVGISVSEETKEF